MVKRGTVGKDQRQNPSMDLQIYFRSSKRYLDVPRQLSEGLSAVAINMTELTSKL